MNTTLNEKIIAYMALISGLSVSAVAVYYSVAGLTAIFSAAVIPIIIMGVALEVGKIIATVWLKQNWNIAHWTIKTYLCIAVALLMVITSMGIFGFLSKAHSDQNLVSGDIQSKIAIYDEKIKIEKDNIDANRKALKQLDESVDQVMARSQDEKGADKAVAIRKSQQKERSRLGQEITESQKHIATLNDERAPIAAEVRKVEAEVGPIKYIAAFVYGANPDESILERAVTWVILLIIVVFDPLALILLISSQISFQKFKEKSEFTTDADGTIIGINPNTPLTQDQIDQVKKLIGENSLEVDNTANDNSTVPETINCYKCGTELINAPGIGLFCPNKECDVLDNYKNITTELDDKPVADEILSAVVTNSNSDNNVPVTEPVLEETKVVPVAPTPVEYREESRMVRTKVFPKIDVVVPIPETYVQNEEQKESNLWTNTTTGQVITQEEYLKTSQENQKG